MKDFNDFTPKDKKYKGDSLGTFKDLAKKYEGKTTDEMMQAILEEAERSRRNGTLTDKEVDRFYGLIAPLLNTNQRQMLDDVVSKLKDKRS